VRNLLLSISFVAFNALPGISQVVEIDSLQKLLETTYALTNTASDTSRVNVLVELAALSIRVNPDASLNYSKESLRLSIQRGYRFKLSEIYNNTGTVYRIKGDFNRAKEFHQKAFEFDSSRNYRRGMALSLNNIGNVHYSKGELDEAISQYKRSLSIRQDINDMSGVGRSLNNLGLVYKIQGDYERALAYYQNALAIFKEIEDKVGMANAMNNVGIIYRLQGNREQALELFVLANNQFEELGNKVGIAFSLNNIGNIYFQQDDVDKALEFYNLSLGTSEEIGDKPAVATKLSNIGGAYQALGETDKALEFTERSLKMQREMGDMDGEVANLNNMGNIYKDRNELDKALDYFLSSLATQDKMGLNDKATGTLYSVGELYKKKGNPNKAKGYLQRALRAAKVNRAVEDQQKAYNMLSETYADMGDFKQSYEYQQLNAQLTDSLDRIVSTKDLAEMQVQFEALRIERELVEINKEKEIQKERLGRQFLLRNFLIVLALLIFLLAVLIYWRYRTKSKANQELDKKNREIHAQKELVEEQHYEITSSITYAKRIQDAILPTMEEIREYLPESFVFYRPKAIVSGDFYWFAQTGDKVLVAAVDCTGHGVPGAFMSMIGNDLLNQIVNVEGKDSPDKILDQLHKEVQIALKQKHGVSENHDGMDVALVAIDKKKKQLEFASANRYLYLFGKDGLKEFEGQDKNIGGIMHEDTRSYKMETAAYESGDMIYLFSDGVNDQFGGPKGKKFGYRQLKGVLGDMSQETPEVQQEKFSSTMNKWMEGEDQIDDFLLIGIRL
jgi:tetratricopeptide (TPR) repeat protein